MCCLNLLLADSNRFLLSYSAAILIFGFLIAVSPIMAGTPFLKDPAAEGNLRSVAYFAGFLSAFISILGFTATYTWNKKALMIIILITSINIVILGSLAVHAISFLSYHVAILPERRILALMNRTWVGLEGESFQRAERCCGVYGPQTYSIPLPPSCCGRIRSDYKCSISKAYRVGCITAMRNYLRNQSYFLDYNHGGKMFILVWFTFYMGLLLTMVVRYFRVASYSRY